MLVSSRAETAPRLSLREEQRQLTRRKLKEAARQVFVNGNYANSSIDFIAREAGVSRATFYLHYQSKVAILNELVEDDGRRQEALFSKLAAVSDPTHEDFVRWLDSYKRATLRERHVVSFWQLAVGLHPELAPLFSALRDRKIDILAAAHPAFRWRDAKPEAGERQRIRAHLLLVQIEQLFFSLVVSAWPLDQDRSIEVIADEMAAFFASRP